MKPQRLDNRYSIRREFCGYATPRWVARFCGDWIGQAETRDVARELALQFAKARNHALAIGK
jgi:hypothetical protein